MRNLIEKLKDLIASILYEIFSDNNDDYEAIENKHIQKQSDPDRNIDLSE